VKNWGKYSLMINKKVCKMNWGVMKSLPQTPVIVCVQSESAIIFKISGYGQEICLNKRANCFLRSRLQLWVISKTFCLSLLLSQKITLRKLFDKSLLIFCLYISCESTVICRRQPTFPFNSCCRPERCLLRIGTYFWKSEKKCLVFPFLW
jgi:hypothetical protein